MHTEGLTRDYLENGGCFENTLPGVGEYSENTRSLLKLHLVSLKVSLAFPWQSPSSPSAFP